MIRYISIILLFTINSNTLFGQDIPIGKIYVNGLPFKVVGSEPSSFQFETSGTVLTKTSIEYLNNFGRFYKENISTGNKYFIKWDNGSSEEEQKDIGLTVNRLMKVTTYLEANFDISGIRTRYSELVTITCDAFLSSTGNCLLR